MSSNASIWTLYEQRKQELVKKNLSHDQYERELRKIIDELGV